MHGRPLRKHASVVDARSLMVECPDHKGLLLPVTDVRIAYNRTTDQSGKRGKEFMVIDIEALCVYCNNYKHIRVREGCPTRFSEDEQALLAAVTAFVVRCPGMFMDENLDTMTAAGRSRASLATVIHMGMRDGTAMISGRPRPRSTPP